MYLKSLELFGFKSFPDRTKLLFEKGTTVIVGPNGSGKSNLSDAMKWVLGEISTKSIRGTKMEDIIFSGTESRKPTGYAEVSVTFDNSDTTNRLDCPYDEVTVTRRYYRAGESEYLINRRPVKLRDIYKLFMNTGIGRDGYSIIGQGKIAEILSRKSEERREIFEDASGIAKFRYQKNEAERKLSQTMDNYARANDIFLEVESQIGPLEKEAAKAKKAIELIERKKESDVRLWLYNSERLKNAIDATTDELKRAEYELSRVTEALESIQSQSDILLERSQNNKAASEELLEKIRIRTNANFKIESDLRLTERNIAHTKELIAAAEATLAGYSKTIESERASADEKRKYIEECRTLIKKLNDERSDISEKKAQIAAKVTELRAATERAFNDQRILEADSNDIRTQIAVLKNASEGSSDSNDSALREIESYEKENVALASQCAAKKRLLDTYNGNIAKLNERLTKLNGEYDSLSDERDTKMQALSRMIFRRDSASQRLDTFKALEEQYDGYVAGVKYVMKCYSEGKIRDRYGNPCGIIYGPLSKVVSVEDKYLTAIEVALGANLQNIVVDDESTAKAAMFALKQAEKGRATFFPLTSMRGQSPSKEITESSKLEGFVAVADELIKCDAKFSHIISSLLARTAVFENIDSANAAAKKLGYRLRIVTLDGQQINLGGSFTGGSVNRNGGMLTRASEIKHLEDELAELEAETDALKGELDTLENSIDELGEDISEAENSKHLTEAMASSILPEYEKLNAKLETNSTLLEKMRGEISTIQSRRAEYEEEARALDAELIRISEQLTEIKAFREEKTIEANNLEDEVAKYESSVTELYIRISNLEKDIETNTTLLEDSERRISDILRDIEALTEKKITYCKDIEEYEKAIADNRRAAEEGSLELANLNAERGDIEEAEVEYKQRIADLTVGIRNLHADKEIAMKNQMLLQNKLEGLKTEQDKLAPELIEEYGLTRADALKLGYPQIADDGERKALVAIQTECRNKLRVIGHVDLGAVEKYDELKVRYDEMAENLKDIRESEEKIRAEVKELDDCMKLTFLDAFNKINENFGRVFSELFGGGNAEVLLTDPDDVLNSGIEIKAAPPGKIIKSLMQLSGGEQSFVAIALFFAILQVNPTPFCILDEIEAALDDVNVARFASYIKRYSNETQFIVISHRRGTMEAAERLYGVTMPDRGISKVLNLVLSELAGKGDKKLDELFG